MGPASMATLPTDDALRPRTPGAYPREEPMKAAEVGLPSPVTTARNAVARLSFDDLARRTTIPPPSSAPGDRSQTATVGGTSSQNPTQNPGPPDLFGQRGRPSIPVKPNTNRYAFRTRSPSQVAVAEGANRHRSRSAHARNASRTRGHASQPRSRVSARLQPQSSQTSTATSTDARSTQRQGNAAFSSIWWSGIGRSKQMSGSLTSI